MLLLLAAVLAGAILQRISGIGFAMVVAPFTIIAIGPAQGVVLVQICGIASALLVLAQVRRDVDWPACLALLPTSFIGVSAGALATAHLPAATAQVASAVVMLLALAGSAAIGRLGRVPRTFPLMAATGGIAGTMTVLAGVGGVALTALQQATRWEHRPFVATLQPYLVALSTGTVVARLATTADAWPALTPAGWAGIIAMMAIGIAIGNRATAWLNASVASRITVALSLLGALSALLGGLLKL